jgi:hypothetical protein
MAIACDLTADHDGIIRRWSQSNRSAWPTPVVKATADETHRHFRLTNPPTCSKLRAASWSQAGSDLAEDVFRNWRPCGVGVVAKIYLLSAACSADNRIMVSNSLVTLQRTLAIVAVLLLYAPKANTAAAQAADFGFRFDVGDCPTERLDTFTGIFTKDLGGSLGTATAHIALTDAQMSAIYRTIENIRFFDYPTVFVGGRPGVEVITTTPSNTYRFEVKNAGMVHAVSWQDSDTPTTVEADHLRDLFRRYVASSMNIPSSSGSRLASVAASRSANVSPSNLV